MRIFLTLSIVVCIRLRAEHPNHVWSYDFVHHRTDDGKVFRALNILDEFSRECLAIRIKRKLNSTDVIDTLTDLFILRGVPAYVRSDNGPEFIAAPLQEWLRRVGIQPMQIYPGSPWENGYNERFNGTLRREVLNAEWFHTTKQAQVAINVWLRQYNQIRPHHALNMRPPVPETLLEKPQFSGAERGG